MASEIVGQTGKDTGSAFFGFSSFGNCKLSIPNNTIGFEYYTDVEMKLEREPNWNGSNKKIHEVKIEVAVYISSYHQVLGTP